MAPGLFVNGLYADPSRGPSSMIRVLAVDDKNDRVAIFAMHDSMALPEWRDAQAYRTALAIGGLLPVTPGPETSEAVRPAARLSAAALRLQQERWELICRLVTDRSRPDLSADRRGLAVTSIVAAHAGTRQRVYACLRLYWRGGQVPAALAPAFDKRGAPGVMREAQPDTPKRGRPRRTARTDPEQAGVNITPDVRARLLEGVEQYYLKPDPITQRSRSLAQAYRVTMGRLFAVGLELRDGEFVPVLPPAHCLPSEGQFRYYAKLMLDKATARRLRAGVRRYLLRHRPLLGSTAGRAGAPGALYQVDATIADIWLVSSLRAHRLIGRPVCYFVTDLFSSMIVGLAVTLSGPDWLGLSSALQSAFIDKVEFCRRYGITIEPDDWPCAHVPQAVVGDRGKELLARHGDHVVQNLQLTLSNLPPRRPDWKANVERLFGRTNEEVLRWVPGAVNPGREHGDRDPRRDAALTLHDFTRLLVKFALYHNQVQRVSNDVVHQDAIHAGVQRTPLALWRWGVEHRSGDLRVVDPELIRLHLLPRVEATVTEDGLSVNGLFYVGAAVDRTGGMLRGQSRRRGPRLTVAYDPRDVSAVWVGPDGGRSPEVLRLHPSCARFEGRTLEEVRDQREVEKDEEARRREEQLRRSVEFDFWRDDLVDQAKDRSRAAANAAAVAPRRAREADNQRMAVPAARAEERREQQRTHRKASPKSADDRCATSHEANLREPAARRDVPEEYIAPADETALLRAQLDTDDPIQTEGEAQALSAGNQETAERPYS